MNTPKQTLTLRLHPEDLAVCRLPADAPLPLGMAETAWASITRTRDELSIVCAQQDAPPTAQTEFGWRMLEVVGPLPFEMIGVLAGLSETLAQAEISIFAISTYDTDYLLLKRDDLFAGVRALQENGYRVIKLSGKTE